MRHPLILVLGSIRLPAGGIERARAAMRKMIEASRREEGCVACFYAEDVLDPGLIHIKEIWAAADALAAHLQTPHLQAWRATWTELEISDRNLASYEIDNPRAL